MSRKIELASNSIFTSVAQRRPMIRIGAVEQEMRSMIADDVLVTRLQLLIVMAKAYLKGYPLGRYRRQAIYRNARFVFHEAVIRTNEPLPKASKNQVSQKRPGVKKKMDHLFLQRAQLLAVMLNAFIDGKSEGNFRSRAMAENVDHICEYLSDRLQLGDAQFLKVA
jgi:hypothetical protein